MTENSIPSKKCMKCGNSYPATLDFFHKSKHCQYGVTSRCKSCLSAWQKAHYHTPEVKARRAVSIKTYADTHREQKHQAYLKRASNPEWREAKQAKQRATYATDEYREYNRKRSQTKARKQYQRGYNVKWRTTPAGHAAGLRSSDRRRVRFVNAEGGYTGQDIATLYKSQKGRCWWCGKKIKANGYHIDHRIPISRGGTNAPENLCISCPTCNLSKGSKLPQEWNGRLL